MKIEHYVWLERIIQSKPNFASIHVTGIEDYKKEDFNAFLAISILQRSEILTEEELAAYLKQKHCYLWEKKIALPALDYTGNLASEYIALTEEAKKVMDDPDYRLNMNSLFNSVHFGDEIPKDLPDATNQMELHHKLSMLLHSITEKISEEIGQLIDTITIKYKTAPVTLLIQPFKYDEAEFEKLNTLANKIIKSVSVNVLEDNDEHEGIITIEYY